MATTPRSTDTSVVVPTDVPESSGFGYTRPEQQLEYVDNGGSPADTSAPHGGPINTPSSISTPLSTKRPLDDSAEPTVFLGESSPLTCVIDEGRMSPARGRARPQRSRLRYSIPVTHDAPAARNDFLRAHKQHLEERLSREGAFLFPSDTISATLLNAYFTWFHPCFPILDRAVVYGSYTNETMSPLLRQAIYFIGISLCTDAAFDQIGFEDRYQAKFLFYSRAKALYDADWESNTITKLQSLFLLSFWRGGPSEERDTRFWLGIAITLAQKRGIHVM